MQSGGSRDPRVALGQSTRSNLTEMERFEIQPVLASALREVASFLCTQPFGRDEDSSVPPPVRGQCLSIERRLRWLLLENPGTTSGSPHGFCIRDHLGIIRGLTLCFPEVFLASDQRLLGLCSGSFFVEPQARMAGFYLFKKYLSCPGYSFFFATTCNTNSAPLWEKLGGCAVPNSEVEYVLPLRLDTLLPALLAEKTSSGVAAAIARMFGRWGNPLLKLERRAANLSIEACQDWQKLAELFRRHRPKETITAERSAEFLKWRYGRNSDDYPSGVYLFRDKRGNEGWFSLGNMMRGRRGEIRGCILLDAIWPREKMNFKEIFPGILQLVAARADVLSFRPRLGHDYCECSRWIIQRRWAAPSAFVITRKGERRSAAGALDLACADGDSALPISPLECSAVDAVSRSERHSLGPRQLIG